MSEQSFPTLLLEEDQATTVFVPPVHYGPLRLLAETAAGLAGKQANLFFRGEQLHRSGGLPFEPTDVLVPVSDRGRFPENIVTLSVTLDASADSYSLPVGVADAVFWSDSAVHKFLVPYLASTAGHQAAEVLTSLQQVWNHYRDDLVTVYAIVHLTAQAAGEVGLEHNLCVVYTELGATKLQVGSLAVLKHDERFKKEHVPTPVPADTEYQQPILETSQRPGYRVLRAMAEWAASIRDSPQYFVFPADRAGFHLAKSLPTDPQPGDFVIPALTFAVPQKRPQLLGVWFQAEGSSEAHNLAGEQQLSDAAFWSTGALEQFLFPYYASKAGLQSLPELMELYTVWVDTSMSATYGIIHLPSSQWIEEEEAVIQKINLVRELSVVARMEEGDSTQFVRLHRLL